MAALHTLHTPLEAAHWLRGRVTGRLTTDSRKVRAGDGFIAWPGAATDGRRYVNAALASGASACLVASEGLEAFALEGDAIAGYAGLKAATGPIAAAYFEGPSHELDVVAVTGTNGKTSTAWWLAHALTSLTQTTQFQCGLVGTLGIGTPHRLPASQGAPSAYGFSIESNGLTTPDPVLLQESLRHFVAQGLTACALEASSIGIAENRLDGTRIRMALFTNFTQDHLDYHGSMLAYWQAKAALFDWPGLRAAVVNVDDSKGAELASQLARRVSSDGEGRALDVWTVSCETTARLYATDITYDESGLRFNVVENNERHGLRTRMIGYYNVANLLGVMAAMRALGVPLAECAQVCRSLPPVPGRMECLGSTGEPLVAVDYAHTPDALEKALLALQPLAALRGGNLWCVFGCGGNRDAGKRPVMGGVAARLADRVVVTSDNPRNEVPNAIIDQVIAGMTLRSGIEIQADRGKAIFAAVLQANARDVVLVAGKGHENYQEIAGQKWPFADQDQVRAALLQRQQVASSQGVSP
jgi:UDP-N-acetylmuramyl-tripeptide synthetase